MEINLVPEKLRRWIVPGRIEFAKGGGGMPLIRLRTPWSTAEVYLHGAHVTGFQKHAEPPLLYLGRKSYYAADKPIRGGVPICFPWFGPRAGDVAHGFARTADWELANAVAAPDGAVTLHFRLPPIPGRESWHSLRTTYAVTVADRLTLELTASNDSAETLAIENCLHTYFQVGDIRQVSLAGLQGAAFLDNAAGGHGARKVETDPALRLTQETNRIYPDTTRTVAIRDDQLGRTILVEKFNSRSTVVWNPWTTQLMPDLDPAEHQSMVCVESGNLQPNGITLTPGQTSVLKVVLQSQRAGP
jgi:D-hexose-6-phosphate mutarotase